MKKNQVLGIVASTVVIAAGALLLAEAVFGGGGVLVEANAQRRNGVSRGSEATVTTRPAISISAEESTSSVSAELAANEAARADVDLTLTDMLRYAIQDEYAARAEYQALIDVFGATRPFTNILPAEDSHIAALSPLFETYGVPVPVDSSSLAVVVPSTLAEAFPIGVQAEELNIAMYERFLKEDLPADVRLVFENLKSASEKHLAAFERGVR